jgi:hypothetical protein
MDEFIEITPEEAEICRKVAIKQYETHYAYGHKHRVDYKPGEDPIENLWIGQCGEMAVAKYTGEPYEGGVGRFKSKPDQSGFDVRTRTKWRYELNIRKGDRLDRPWILVTEIEPKRKYVIRGWIDGTEALKVPLTSPDGRTDARFVPTPDLHPMEEHPRKTAKWGLALRRPQEPRSLSDLFPEKINPQGELF